MAANDMPITYTRIRDARPSVVANQGAVRGQTGRWVSQQVAADAVGISVRSAQRIDRGKLRPQGQHQLRGRHWRTRADPIADVWDSVMVTMLEKAPQLESQTLLLHLEQTFPSQEWFRHKRTLQRRV